jgi:hypothetical protein
MSWLRRRLTLAEDYDDPRVDPPQEERAWAAAPREDRARAVALALWRNHAIDAHVRARRRERAAALATALLAIVLLVLGIVPVAG